MSYHLEYVEKPGKFDEVVEQDGVKVLIDSKALFSIIGSEMDWKDDRLRWVIFTSETREVITQLVLNSVPNSFSITLMLKMLAVVGNHSASVHNELYMTTFSLISYNIISLTTQGMYP